MVNALAFFLAGGLAALALALLLRARMGFRAQRPDHYQQTGPAFDPARHLGGRVACDGVIYGPLGRVQSRFNAVMTGTWKGGIGRLHEVFHYASGAQQIREWRITVDAEGRVSAEADDIIGVAEGWVSGAALFMRYRLQLGADNGGHVLDVTDWMYLLPDGSMINRSEMRKFGFKVAELVATLRPLALGERADFAASPAAPHTAGLKPQVIPA